MASDLGLTSFQARRLLKSVVRSYGLRGYRPDVRFSNHVAPGEGAHDPDNDRIVVGTHGVTGPGFILHVDDKMFVKSLVALCHEYGHCADRTDPDTPKHIILSNLSIMRNRGYYMDVRYELPHEISAEWAGVNTAAGIMNDMFGAYGEALVVGYVRDMIDSPASYYLHDGDVSEWTIKGIDDSFRAAMQRSVEEPRATHADIRRYSSAVSKFFKDRDNVPYLRKFIQDIPGFEKDRMVASINVSKNHDLMDDRLSLDDVDIEKAFGFDICSPKMWLLMEQESKRQMRKKHDVQRDGVNDLEL